MSKRCAVGLAVVAALVSPTFTKPVVAEPAAEVPVVPEPIARKMVTSSPQTTGPTGSLSWGLDRIDQRGPLVAGSSGTYNFANTGDNVNIYVLDSGVNASHPEFGSRVVDGWSYRAYSTPLNSYKAALTANQQNPNNGIPACVDNPNSPTYPNYAQDPAAFDNPATVDPSDKGKVDNDGHGTHVAGIAAGDGVGVAKNSKIIPVRALDSCGNGTTTMILEGLSWILSDHDAGEKAVLNLSVGFDSRITLVDNKIGELINEGILVVAAAGNGEQQYQGGPFVGVSACNHTPADAPGVIAVGAIQNSPVQDKETQFSNYGSCVDFFAPGGAVPSSYPYYKASSGAPASVNTYVNLSGTSMSTPFVTGALARYLQLLSTAPTNLTTGNTAALSWLNANATASAVTYHDINRAEQTPNRLLYVPSAPAQVSQLTATAAPLSAVVSWQGAIPGATYTVTSTPGSATCSVVGGTTCTLTGLVAGTTYTVSVKGSNADGVGPTAVTTVTLEASPAPPTPAAPPAAPSTAVVSSMKNSVSLSWAASSDNKATYVVTTSPPSDGCTTTLTSCTIAALRYGVNYTFSIVAVSADGVASTTPTKFTVRPGFTVKKTTVVKKSRTTLTTLITSKSRGKKTWSESGPCVISAGRLVAPNRKTTCRVILKVAKWGSYPAMSTTLNVTVK